jgi:hypothetical protein
LTADFDNAGGDHHLFVRVEDRSGKRIPTVVEFHTEGGLRDLRDTLEKRHGWQDVPIWDAGWTWGPLDCEQVRGGQRPWEHISTFAVFQPREQPDPDPDPEPEPSIEVVTAMRVVDGKIHGAWTAGSVEDMIKQLQARGS